MKIASFKKKRETFDVTIRDISGEEVTFTLLPLPSDLCTIVDAFLHGGKSMLSQSQRIRFIEDCLIGWSGVKDEDGEEIDFNNKSAFQLAHSDYDDLITGLVTESYLKRKENEENLIKDKEELGKSQTK